jgi:bifunctional non-homologous end joining protein LigD
MTLAKYKRKRDFKKTPEPKGKVGRKRQSKLLYVIQKHAASHLHYDFRLELQGVLLSWAVPKGPCLDPTLKRLAMHVEDHPLEYGTFEGIIPKGQYGGGTVMLWDEGAWIPMDDNPVEAYKKGSLKFELKGHKLEGLWKLIRINKNDKTWLLIKAQDEYAQPIQKYDITVKESTSVLTDQSIEEITENYNKIWSKKGLEKVTGKKTPTKSKKTSAVKPKPKKIHLKIKPSRFPKEFSPQLATLVDEPPIGKHWIHEIKFDGYRILAIKKNNITHLMSRNGKDWTNKFKSIADSINNIPIENAIFDGEVVILDSHLKSDFQALQNSLQMGDDKNPTYYIFDLPYYDEFNLTTLPLLERKNYLQEVIKHANENIRYSDHALGSGKDILSKSCELNLEGIISKDGNSEYVQRRTKTWLKSKCIKRQEFVIGGYTKPQGKREKLGALLLGTYNKRGELIYNGNVGTGFTLESLNALHADLTKQKSVKNPFTTVPPNVKQVSWVKPVLVCEVEFTEWTDDGNLRHPSFKGLRSDKKPKNVTRESSMPIENFKTDSKAKKATPIKKTNSDYKLTHPTKLFYPEDKITKQDVAEYYDHVQDWILPYIVNRPLTLLRCPDGYKQCFYQKHTTDSMPDSIYGMTIKEKAGKSQCIYIKDGAGLIALPQLGVLEIHPWGSHIDEIEYPDMIIFDLDPSPEVPWKKVVAAAFEIKKHLSEFKLKSFVKTTGGKGLHVVIPIKPEYDWDEVKNFSHTFVNFLVENNPKDYISKMSKSERKGKIFIDYLRNQRGATAVAPYSTRARIHAPVSTPIDWDELTNKREDTFFTIISLPKRLAKLKKDPWADFFKIRQSLKLDKYK